MRKHLFYLLLFLPFFGLAQEWNLDTKLIKSERGAYQEFGEFVAINGDLAIISAWDSQFFNSGRVHVYGKEDGNWVEKQILESSDASEFDGFGVTGVGDYDFTPIAMNDEYIVVGALLEDEDENGENTISNAGAAYIFKLEGDIWVEQQKIVASDRNSNARFGSQISIHGDYMVVGAYDSGYYTEIFPEFFDYINVGAAYVFKLENGIWVEKEKLEIPNAGMDNYNSMFGGSIGLGEDWVAVGAPATSFSEGGFVNLYKRTGEDWELKQTIQATNPASGNMFGSSISINGDFLMVGAYGVNHDQQAAGSVFVYKRNNDTWELQEEIVREDQEFSNENFGFSVDTKGNTMVIGARGKKTTASDFLGRAYIYQLENNVWIEKQDINPSDNLLPAVAAFGTNVATDGANVIVGAPWEYEGEFILNAGAAYIFEVDCAYLTPQVNPIQSICAGESTEITISNGTIVNWYNSADSEIAVFTGTTFETPELTETTSFWVEINDGTCISSRLEVTVNVNPLPVLEAETTYAICSGNEASLYASSPSNVIFWYANEDDTEYLYHGNLFVTEVLTENTTYWVEAYNLSTGCRSERIAVTVTVGEALSAPIAESTQDFVAGMTLADFEVEHTGTLTWYSDAALTQELPETTLVVAGTIYYVTQSGIGCESAATPVTADTFLGNGNLNQDKFAYYPNPVKDVLNFKGNEVVKSVQVYDLNGKLILNQNSNSISSINLSTLPKGTYVVKATTGKAVNTFKIVKN